MTLNIRLTEFVIPTRSSRSAQFIHWASAAASTYPRKDEQIISNQWLIYTQVPFKSTAQPISMTLPKNPHFLFFSSLHFHPTSLIESEPLLVVSLYKIAAHTQTQFNHLIVFLINRHRSPFRHLCISGTDTAGWQIGTIILAPIIRGTALARGAQSFFQLSTGEPFIRWSTHSGTQSLTWLSSPPPPPPNEGLQFHASWSSHNGK